MVAERSFLHTLKALAKLERGELQQIASRSNKIICMEKNNLWPAEENMKDIYIQTHEVVISVVFCKILLVVFQNMSDVKGIRTYCFVFIKDGTSIFCLPFCVCVCEISEVNNLSCTYISFSVICRYWKRHELDGSEICLVHLAAVSMRDQQSNDLLIFWSSL